MKDKISCMFQFRGPDGEAINISTSSNHIGGKAPREYEVGGIPVLSAIEAADFIIDKDESYWQSGMGNGEIQFHCGVVAGRRVGYQYLFISRLDKAGFLLQYENPSHEAVAVIEACADDIDYEIYYHHDRFFVFNSKLFVPPQVARTVILSFLADDAVDGSCLPAGCKWIQKHDLQKDDIAAEYPEEEFPYRFRLPEGDQNPLLEGGVPWADY